MERLFVYETLLLKAVRIDALGHDVSSVKREPAHITPFKEVWVKDSNNDRWPSLIPEENSVVTGQVFSLSTSYLAQLDSWEANYERVELVSNKGPVWVYVLGT